MKTDFDFVVVGAGPAGSEFAIRTADKYSVLLLEENFEVGKPVQCSGLVSPRVMEMSGLRSYHNAIDGMQIIAPSGESYTFSGHGVKGYVIDRSGLDVHLAQQAVRRGAQLMLHSTFRGAERNGSVRVHYSTDGEDRTVTCRLLIGADGMYSTVSRCFGLSRFAEIISCIQCDAVTGEDEGSDVSLYFGRSVAPGFFAWRIPSGTFTRIGLGISEGNTPPLMLLEALLSKLGVRRMLNLTAGPIPLGNKGRIVSDGVMLIGDAAGQAKPISGGGIYTGMAAADIAARVALESAEEQDFSVQKLSRYEREWRGGMGKELSRAMVARKIFREMDDENLNDLFRTLSSSSIARVLAEGDIDFPTRISPLALAAEPSLWRYSPRLIRALL